MPYNPQYSVVPSVRFDVLIVVVNTLPSLIELLDVVMTYEMSSKSLLFIITFALPSTICAGVKSEESASILTVKFSLVSFIKSSIVSI